MDSAREDIYKGTGGDLRPLADCLRKGGIKAKLSFLVEAALTCVYLERNDVRATGFSAVIDVPGGQFMEIDSGRALVERLHRKPLGFQRYQCKFVG